MADSVQANVNEKALASLQSQFQGNVIRPGDLEYDAARAIWNGMIDRRPAVITQCSSTEDVVNAVNFARDHGLLVAVRGGGHNAAGKAVCDDGIVIDLTPLNIVTVDSENQTAWAQGGATWADFDAVTTAHGLATTGGLISTTGVGGLTLGGGFGWLLREHGMACDNLIGAEVVTANGEVVNVSEDENADLLWGLRGGGGNFGIVTNFKFQLHPIDTVTSGMIVHPYERAREAIQRYRDFSMSAPESLTTFCGLMTSPEGEKIVAYIIFHDGPEDEGRELLAPLLEWGPPVAADLAQVPYAQHQQMLDEGFPHGLHVYWRSDFLRELDDDLIDTLIDQFDNVTSPLSALVLEQFGGAVRRVPKDATAFVHREGEYNLAIISRWTPEEIPDSHVAWAREVHDAIRPYSTGVYVNYLGEEGADRIRAAYSEDAYQRLVDLKNKYDPQNLFRLNQNIEPTV